MLKSKTILAAVYSYPEAYPPTINAIENLSTVFDKIIIVCRNFSRNKWEFKGNVKVYNTGSNIHIEESYFKHKLWKIFSFLLFTFKIYTIIKKEKPDLVIAYDAIPLLSVKICIKFLSIKPLIWYHNHDMIDGEKGSVFSVSRYAATNEKDFFSQIDIFSLPALERKQFFPMDKFQGSFFFIPNYPSKIIYKNIVLPKHNQSKITILYQGNIGEGRGLEEIINLIKELPSIQNRELHFIIKGFGNPQYCAKIADDIVQKKLSHRIKILGFGPYSEILTIASESTIGLAIHNRSSSVAKTLGTASNKIYEYAACGLPIIYFDNEHFNAHLNNYKWAFATDLSTKSLKDAIEIIIQNYSLYSLAAREDFEKNLNFEYSFSYVTNFLNTHI